MYVIYHLMMSLCQFTPLELVLDLQITVTWSSRVPVLCVSVSTTSTHPHHLCGTTFRMNWRTATFVDRVSNLALSHDFLSVHNRNRHLCELLFNGCYSHINPHFGWMIWQYDSRDTAWCRRRLFRQWTQSTVHAPLPLETTPSPA